MAIRVLEETGLLPHLNPGVLTWEEIQRLKPVAPSMGMMLETTATRLWSEPGGPHYGSPDKEPAVRLRVLEDAGRSAVPFTTGVLLGIGETYAERVDALFAIRASAHAVRARAGGDRPELPGQAATRRCARTTTWTCRSTSPPSPSTRLCSARRRACRRRRTCRTPPSWRCCSRAGIDDWGGVSPLTPDHVNPERPWPDIDELARADRRGRLHAARAADGPPARTCRAGEPWLDPRVRAARARRSPARTGWPSRAAIPVGLPWQEPDDGVDVGSGRADLHVEVDTVGRDDGPAQRLRRRLRRLVRAARATVAARDGTPRRWRPATARCAPRCATPSTTRPGCSDAESLALLGADGADLDALCALADGVRRDVSRRRRHLRRQPEHQLHQRLLHRLPVLRVRPAAHRRRRLHAVAGRRSATASTRRGRSARPRSACRAASTPTCPAPRTSTSPREVKRRQPGIHLHAFSPMEVVNGATRTGLSIARLPDARRRRPGSTRCPARPRRSSTTTSAGC